MRSIPLLLIAVLSGPVVAAPTMDIQLKLTQPAQGQYRAPYVAVWIENTKARHQATISLWRDQEGAKWLKDLRRWWRKAGRGDQPLVDAMTAATRPAGQYRIRWDGTDNQGQALPAGDYQLVIEVVREHGNRALIKHPFQYNHPFAAELAATAETDASTVTYR